MEKCKLCGMEYETTKSLGMHVAGTHKLSMINYFVDVLGNPAGKCSCGKLTKFRNISVGFSSHCSAKCSYHDPLVESKRVMTNVDRYGSADIASSKIVREKIKKTNRMRYGGDSPMCSTEVQSKVKNTVIDKYGVECVFSLPEIRDKANQTMISLYGEQPLKSPEVREKAKETSRSRYGTDHPCQNEICKRKRKDTSIKIYGVDSPNKSDAVKQKTRMTNMGRYGVEYIPHMSGFMEKVRKTNMEKYGVPLVGQHLPFTEKRKQTCLKIYGVEYAQSNADVRSKIASTMIDRYGVANPMQSDAIRTKAIATNIDRYGVPHYIMTDVAKNNRSTNRQSDMMEKYSTILNSHNCSLISIDKDHVIEYSCGKCGQTMRENYQFVTICRHNLGITPCSVCEQKRPVSSFAEREVADYIRSLGISVDQRNRKLLYPSEIDILIESHGLAIECNGLHFHSELYKPTSYHVTKSDACTLIDIQMVHLFEDDWLYRKDIVKSRLKSLLGLNDRSIYARKCKIAEVSAADATAFLEANHLQGSCQSSTRYGLYFSGELVALMTFGKSRFESGKTELLRYCNAINANVVGGAGKLFKYFIDNNKVDHVVSYADRSWSVGNLYEKLGFSFIGTTPPNYYYVIGDERHNRMHYQKHKLVAAGFDESKTEHEIMLDRGIYRIYDCGNLKYEWNRSP